MTEAAPAPAVSVVLPVYNRAATIGPAIDSVLRQTHADLELLVVDDCSTDATRAVVEAVGDPRLRLLANPRNLGASAARNTGLRAARAPWVAFQDSDDEWLPRKLEKQMARLDDARLDDEGAGVVAVYCGMVILGTPETPAGAGPAEGATPAARLQAHYFPGPDIPRIEGDILPDLRHRSLVSTQTLVARRDLMLEIGGFDEDLPALIDWECLLRLAQHGPVACVDEPLVLQRFSLNSITRDEVRRTAARHRIIDKHRDLFAVDPAALAAQYNMLAGSLRRLGELGPASAAIAQARAVRPLDPRLWAMSGYLLALRLLGRR